MENQSRFDPTRKTVGAMYRDAQFNGEKQIICGDMNYELRKSLVEDINDTVKRGTDEFEGRPFYITVYEKRDLQMKNAFIRRLIKTVYRPYPEADTLVFKVSPYLGEIYFCWELPARFEMLNMLNTPDLRTQPHEIKQLQLFRHWENMRLEHFGFTKNEEANWVENPMYNGDINVTSAKPKEPTISTHQAEVCA